MRGERTKGTSAGNVLKAPALGLDVVRSKKGELRSESKNEPSKTSSKREEEKGM